MSARNKRKQRAVMRPQAGMNDAEGRPSVLQTILNDERRLPVTAKSDVVTEPLPPLVKPTIFAELRDVSECSDEELLAELQKRKLAKAEVLARARDLIKQFEGLLEKLAE